MEAEIWTELFTLPPFWIALGSSFIAGCLFAGLIYWVLLSRHQSALSLIEQAHIAELDAEKRIFAEREKAFLESREQLEASFNLLSDQALKRNADTFLNLANSQLKAQNAQADHQLVQRQQAIESLLKPVTVALTKTEHQIRQMEKDRQQAFGSLEKHLSLLAEDHRELRGETRNLVQALRRPEVRGRWGELTLRRLVEMAGMLEHSDFSEQTQVDGDKGKMRPDMVIHLPDDRQIVVDVKTPLDAYLTAQETTDEQLREQALAQHLRNVKLRIKELAEKAYWDQFSHSPDFVVLFIPGEQFLAAAMDRDLNLLEDALKNRVILASPTSLVALLRAVAYSWRQVSLIKHAEEIRDLAEQFYKRIGTFQEHLGKIGKNLGLAVDSFNSSIGSFERMVLPAAKRLSELGVNTHKEVDEMSLLEKRVRDVD